MSEVWQTLLATLVPVGVGSLLTLLGVVLGPAVTHWLSTSRDEKLTRMKRFEELLSLLDDHQRWMEIENAYYVLGKGEEVRSPSPYPKARAMAALYFPQFSVPFADVNAAAASFRSWMVDNMASRVKKNAAIDVSGYGSAYLPYSNAVTALIAVLVDFAESGAVFRTGAHVGWDRSLTFKKYEAMKKVHSQATRA